MKWFYSACLQHLRSATAAERPTATIALFALAIANLSIANLITPAQAASYNFDILYFGNDVASLAPGSDDPNTTTLQPGDDFLWTIAAENEAYWKVDVGGSFFTLMAFSADPEGDRTGDLNLQLLNNGADVFNFNDTNVRTSQVHVGANSVDLPTGLIFDEMRLDYNLIDAFEVVDPNDPAPDPQPVDTILSGLLPISGPPENSSFYSGISYIVPEPSTLLLALTGLVGLTAGARRRA